MNRIYTVSQDKNTGLWYAHHAGYPYIPCMIDERHTFCMTRREAQHNAAIMMGIPYAEYLKLPEVKN